MSARRDGKMGGGGDSLGGVKSVDSQLKRLLHNLLRTMEEKKSDLVEVRNAETDLDGVSLGAAEQSGQHRQFQRVGHNGHRHTLTVPPYVSQPPKLNAETCRPVLPNRLKVMFCPKEISDASALRSTPAPPEYLHPSVCQLLLRP
jgi:hypothetical protein